MTNKGKANAKGKAPAGKDSDGKRKRGYDDDKTGGLKRKNRGVDQFFEEEADDIDDSEESDSSDLSDGNTIVLPSHFLFRFLQFLPRNVRVSLTFCYFIPLFVTIMFLLILWFTIFIFHRLNFYLKLLCVDSYEDEYETLSTRNVSDKGQSSYPSVPKQELVDEEEYDRLMEERVNSRFFTFAGDGDDEFEDKPMDKSSLHHALKESIPTIWKVKCTVCYLKLDF